MNSFLGILVWVSITKFPIWFPMHIWQIRFQSDEFMFTRKNNKSERSLLLSHKNWLS